MPKNPFSDSHDLRCLLNPKFQRVKKVIQEYLIMEMGGWALIAHSLIADLHRELSSCTFH